MQLALLPGFVPLGKPLSHPFVAGAGEDRPVGFGLFHLWIRDSLEGRGMQMILMQCLGEY